MRITDLEPRWRFAAFARNPAEDAARERVRERIDAWWAEFSGKREDLDLHFRQKKQWDLPLWMATHLRAIHPKLAWEFGPGSSGGHRLVISPESLHHLRPMVDEILSRAPQFPGWEFHAYRQVEAMDRALAAVKARTGGDVAGGCFKAAIGEGHRIDITFGYARSGWKALTGRRSAPAEEDLGPFFVATECLLGEEMLDEWVGGLQVSSKDAQGGAPLSELRPTMIRLIEQIRSGLRGQPWTAPLDSDAWSVIERTKHELPDCAGRADMYVATSPNVEMWKASVAEWYFASSRFSRFGETFCYVKIDGSEGGLRGSDFKDKGDIEDALGAALRAENVGGVVGGGTGWRYSYVDLAVADVDRAIEVVRRVLQAGKLKKRAWILFLDTEWEREWVGVYDDSPPPSMRERDD